MRLYSGKLVNRKAIQSHMTDSFVIEKDNDQGAKPTAQYDIVKMSYSC